MPINQPPIDEDITRASWDYELVNSFNRLEARFDLLITKILEAQDLDALKEEIRSL